VLLALPPPNVIEAGRRSQQSSTLFYSPLPANPRACLAHCLATSPFHIFLDFVPTLLPLPLSVTFLFFCSPILCLFVCPALRSIMASQQPKQELDPKYDQYDFPSVAPRPQKGHPGFTTPTEDAQVYQLRMTLEQEGYKARLDTITLVPLIWPRCCSCMIH
jgi:hypothetical protein